MKLAYQIAQKLHAVSEAASERAHDLIDLQLICNRSQIDYAEVKSVCQRLFDYRRRQPWPTGVTALPSWDDLYVLEEDSAILAAGVINQLQVDVYAGAPWEYEAEDSEVCVFHTLTVDPDLRGKGIGTRFMGFYEQTAREMGCPELRIDTNARNTTARTLYKKLGYKEIDIVPTVFNGIPGVNLVLLEKHLG